MRGVGGDCPEKTGEVGGPRPASPHAHDVPKPLQGAAPLTCRGRGEFGACGCLSISPNLPSPASGTLGGTHGGSAAPRAKRSRQVSNPHWGSGNPGVPAAWRPAGGPALCGPPPRARADPPASHPCAGPGSYLCAPGPVAAPAPEREVGDTPGGRPSLGCVGRGFPRPPAKPAQLPAPRPAPRPLACASPHRPAHPALLGSPSRQGRRRSQLSPCPGPLRPRSPRGCRSLPEAIPAPGPQGHWRSHPSGENSAGLPLALRIKSQLRVEPPDLAPAGPTAPAPACPAEAPLCLSRHRGQVR